MNQKSNLMDKGKKEKGKEIVEDDNGDDIKPLKE